MVNIISALIAEGTSLISGIEEIDRGYEKIDERLWEKFTDMSFALNDAWPTVLDYDGARKDIPKNEAQKDYTSLVDHLKELREKEDGN